jgi:hypothetical protein
MRSPISRGQVRPKVVACVRRFDAGHRPGANRTAPCLWRCGADGAHGPLGRDAGLQHRRRADRSPRLREQSR